MGIKRSFGNVVDQIGFGKRGWFQAFVGGSVYTADGAAMLTIGSIATVLEKEWGITGAQSASIVSLVFCGAFLGCFCSGYIGDNFGRKLPMLASYAGVAIFSVSSSFVQHWQMLMLLQFFVGMSFGLGIPAYNTFSSEISPAAMRLWPMAVGQALFSLGEVWSGTMIWIDDPQMENVNWRWLLSMGSIPAAFFFVIALLFLYESPHYLVTTGQKKEAEAVLEHLAKDNPDVNDVGFEHVEESHKKEARWTEVMPHIFGKYFMYTTLTLCWLTFTCNFIYYGMLYALPQVLGDLKLPVSPALNLMISAAAELPGVFIGVWLGYNVTRRLSLQIYLGFMMLTLAVFVLSTTEVFFPARDLKTDGFHTWAFIGLYSLKVFSQVGWILVYLYSCEVFPTVARTTGSAIPIAIGRLGAIICPYAFEFVDATTGSHANYILSMCILCAFAIVLVSFLPYETKDKKLCETFEEFELRLSLEDKLGDGEEESIGLVSSKA